ncbi:MAG TPA: biotin/lipoyl-binding protein, partial [Burkholderiaceae bacterium]|nr:biotin/lipoyl-binding protein [Burkholderiaceae bacterium]
MSVSSSALNLPPLADALRESRPDADQRRAFVRLAQLMLWPLLVAGALLVGWMAAAPLAGAVVAPATAKVELNRKTVQHQEGGIVREILVRDGQRVKAGEPLLVIADLRSQAELAQLHDQLLAARVREARAATETGLAPRFDLPPDLAADAGSAAHVLRERAVFAARRQALEEQGSLMAAQSSDAREQALALETQIEATGQSIRISDEELAINDRLANEGFVHRTRLLSLQRVVADYRTRLGEHRSELAAVRQ